jgi:hypothetical protein
VLHRYLRPQPGSRRQVHHERYGLAPSARSGRTPHHRHVVLRSDKRGEGG